MGKTILVFGGLVIVFSSVIFAFACYAFKVPGIYRIANQGMTAEGRVLETQPENRNHVKYAYQVGGNNYQGTGGVGDRFETIKPGDSIRVFYDPLDPGESLLGTSSHHELFVQTVVVSAVFSVVMGFLSALGFFGFRLNLLRRHR